MAEKKKPAPKKPSGMNPIQRVGEDFKEGARQGKEAIEKLREGARKLKRHMTG